jgi:hypothetical protein
MSFSGIGNSVTFVVASGGPQGASGLPFSGVVPLTASAGLSLTQSGTMFTNTGAIAEVDLTLPAAPSTFYPVAISALVVAAETLSLVAPPGVTITNGADSSSSGGSISSNTVGNFVTVTLISATQWIVTSIVGVWELN